jgi:predicted RND superfamily exporter protein
VWDVILPAPARLDEAYLERVRRLEQQLRGVRVNDAHGNSVPALTKVLSLVDGIDAATVNPLMAKIPAELRARGMATTMPTFIAALRTSNPASELNYLRIMLRAREQQPAAEKAWLIDEVRRLAMEAFPADQGRPAAKVTGFYVLLTNLIKSILRDQWVCFLVATVGIGLMMTVAFRSARLAVMALIPNALPILFVLGGLGLAGLRINMGAAMIAAVSMGLSVDSSIHYVIAFRRARRAGLEVPQAIAEVQQSVGRAVVFSTLALMVGFLVLCSSKFVPTIYFGALAALSMLGGLLGNLLVLPLLLHLFAARDSHASGDGGRREP